MNKKSGQKPERKVTLVTKQLKFGWVQFVTSIGVTLGVMFEPSRWFFVAYILGMVVAGIEAFAKVVAESATHEAGSEDAIPKSLYRTAAVLGFILQFAVGFMALYLLQRSGVDDYNQLSYGVVFALLGYRWPLSLGHSGINFPLSLGTLAILCLPASLIGTVVFVSMIIARKGQAAAYLAALAVVYVVLSYLVYTGQIVYSIIWFGVMLLVSAILNYLPLILSFLNRRWPPKAAKIAS
jgi:hypothetical protein